MVHFKESIKSLQLIISDKNRRELEGRQVFASGWEPVNGPSAVTSHGLCLEGNSTHTSHPAAVLLMLGRGHPVPSEELMKMLNLTPSSKRYLMPCNQFPPQQPDYPFPS